MAHSSSPSQIHIGGAAFSWQMPYKFFYKFLKTKEKDEHVLGPIFVCGNLAWRLEWLPHGQVGDMDDPDNYGLFLRLDSLPGDIESVNARFTVSSPCGHYHTDEGSVFSRYNEPMSFGRGNFGKISELTEWIDAIQDSRPASGPSGSQTGQQLMTVFEVSVSINRIRRLFGGGAAAPGVNNGSAVQPMNNHGFGFGIAEQPPVQQHVVESAAQAMSSQVFGGLGVDPLQPGSQHHVQAAHNLAILSEYNNSDSSSVIAAQSGVMSSMLNAQHHGNMHGMGGSHLQWAIGMGGLNPHEPERAPPESLDDIDVEGIRRVLAEHRLDRFLNDIIDLGVEVPSDMSFLSETDLTRIGCNVVQQRKFLKVFMDMQKCREREDEERRGSFSDEFMV